MSPNQSVFREKRTRKGHRGKKRRHKRARDLAKFFRCPRMRSWLVLHVAAASAVSTMPTAPRVTPRVTLRGARAPRVRAQAGGGYRVRLRKPLGIIFEESEVGAAKGVVVAGLVEGGAAEADGRILVGDRLLRVSAVLFGGDPALLTVGTGQQFTKVRRELIPATGLDFDTIMSAIGSNDGRYGYMDVVLELAHTDGSIPRRAGAQRAARLDDDDDGAEWDGRRGTTVRGVSTPIRAPRDDF